MFLSLSLSPPVLSIQLLLLSSSQPGWLEQVFSQSHLLGICARVGTLRLACLRPSSPKRLQEMCYCPQAAQAAGTGVHCLLFSCAGLAGACCEDGVLYSTQGMLDACTSVNVGCALM